MSIEIRIYPSERLQSDEHLLFHTCVYGPLKYDVYFDLAELYEYSFKTALEGTFISEHLSFSLDKMQINKYIIDGTDYIENIKKFCEYVSEYEKVYCIYSQQKIQ